MMDNAFNKALFLQMSDGNASKGPVDLESLNEDALRDELEGRDLLDDTVVCGLVKGNSVLGLILDLSLGPLLLLGGLSTTGSRRGCLSFGLQRSQSASSGLRRTHPAVQR